MVTVFLTSCDKDIAQPETAIETIEENTLLSNFDGMSLNEKIEKLNSFSLEDFSALGFEQSEDEISLRDYCWSWHTYHVATGNCWTKNYQVRACVGSNGYYTEYRVKNYSFC